MKRTISLILALIMCITAFALTASAAEIKFNDVKETDWFYGDVMSAVEMGLINGKGEGVYAPNDNLTYAEAAKLAVAQRVMGKLIKLNAVMEEFVKEGNYAKLPTEAEKFKAEQDLKEAKQAEREIIAESAKDNAVQKPIEDESHKISDNVEKTDLPDIKKAEAKVEDAVSISDKKKTVVEAENTPEARKLKRAKNGYDKCDFSAQTVVFTNQKSSRI